MEIMIFCGMMDMGKHFDAFYSKVFEHTCMTKCLYAVMSIDIILLIVFTSERNNNSSGRNGMFPFVSHLYEKPPFLNQ